MDSEQSKRDRFVIGFGVFFVAFTLLLIIIAGLATRDRDRRARDAQITDLDLKIMRNVEGDWITVAYKEKRYPVIGWLGENSASAGLKPGDLLVAVNDISLADPNSLKQKQLGFRSSGGRFYVTFVREQAGEQAVKQVLVIVPPPPPRPFPYPPY